MSNFSQYVLISTVIFFSITEETYAQNSKYQGDSYPFTNLSNYEYTLNYNQKMMDDLSRGLMLPNRLMKKTLYDMPFQYEIHSNEINHMPLFNTLNLSEGILNSKSTLYPVLGNQSILLSGNQESMPSIFYLNSISAGFAIKPVDNLSINIYGSGVKFRDLLGIHNDFTINNSTYLSISDKWTIVLKGRYLVNETNTVKVGDKLKSPFAPSTYFGGGVEYKFTEKFSLECGIKREYDAFGGEWINMFYLIPKFK